MMISTDDFKRYVLDDLKNYEGLCRPVRASLLERLLVKKTKLDRLHPNPDDEFCFPSIGPNYEIISSYIEKFKFADKRGEKPLEEPLLVEKISTGGYMILNGHHRWFAAHRLGFKEVPVEIANVIPEETILNRIQNSERYMCVSFDLDEVLMTDGTAVSADRKLSFPMNLIFKKTLRRNAPALISELQKLGFDVWIYSGSYHSEQYIRLLFLLHKTKVDGIINFLKPKQGNAIRDAFRSKYRYSVHIDNDGVLWVNTGTKEYDSISIDTAKKDWAAGAYFLIKNLKLGEEPGKQEEGPKNS